MPLVEVQPPEQPKNLATGRAIPVTMASALVQSRFEPRQSLLTMIQGSIFVSDYFNQVLDKNDAAKAQAQNLDAPYQQYNLIRALEGRLQGDFSFSANDDDKTKTVTGEMIIYPGVVPNDGDMFLADTGDGRRGIFTVTRCVPLSYYKQTCYTIQFQQIAVDDAARIADLESKIVERFIYVTDFMRFGKNPVLLDSLYNDYRTLFRIGETMIGEYLRLFFSEVSQTLMIPGQEWDGRKYNAYDPFIVNAVLGVLETTQHPLLRKVSKHNTEAQYAFRTTTIWDALLQIEPSHLHLACQRMGLAPKGVAWSRANFGGVYWSKIDVIMYPMEAREDADSSRTYNPEHADLHRLSSGPAPVRDFFRLISVKDATGNQVVETRTDDQAPNIHDVNVDDYYVFSQAFYQEDYTKMSHLERMVWSVLNQEEIDVPKLSELVQQSKRWDKLERFYYIPVLMVLVGLAMRGPSI